MTVLAPGAYKRDSQFYDPLVARFIQPDTMIPRPGDPQSLNRYSYVVNNPMTRVDPTGHTDELGNALNAWDHLITTGDVSGAASFCYLGCDSWTTSMFAHGVIQGDFGFFDVGKHNDTNFDNNAWKGDFEAIARNKHGNASWAQRWAAQMVLDDGSYEAYKTKAQGSWYSRTGSWVGNFAIEFGKGAAAAGAGGSAFFACGPGCALLAGAGVYTALDEVDDCVRRSCGDLSDLPANLIVGATAGAGGAYVNNAMTNELGVRIGLRELAMRGGASAAAGGVLVTAEQRVQVYFTRKGVGVFTDHLPSGEDP